ncbi:aldose epimerase family protein [Flavobacterium sp. RHBU_3]|uniref:aldose epimerase family protein n=1 Tax=Flavobacterium sp. RHBU_3 TaxID=3391184 RepID=UPI0039851BCD
MENSQISYFTPKCVTNLFGILPDGKEVYSYTLGNGRGLEATFINYGATITSLKAAAGDEVVDTVLGFDNIQNYIQSFGLPSGPYFGSVIGRYAGRISQAEVTLNGGTYKLNANNNGNTLHGGLSGFGRAYWQMKRIQGGERPSIVFTYTSPDGEENFPGNLTIEVEYTLTPENELLVNYTAVTDKTTVLNLTQHSYFNLGGHTQTLERQLVQVTADEILEVTPEGIPTGNFTKVAGTALDFNQAAECPRSIDNSFVLPQNYERLAAKLYNPENGLEMTVYTDQPSVHIYVGGNCFGQLKGKEGADYHPYSGICFEAQNYPDAPNQPHFPKSVLNPGETYTQRTKFQFKHIL